MSAIVYLLQVSACMGIFYSFYYFMLNRLTFFTINRWYLLATLFLSFVIPLLTIPVQQHDTYPAVIQQAVYVNAMQNMPVYTPSVTAPIAIVEPAINWMNVLKMLYITAVIALFIRLVIMFTAFFVKLKHKKSTRIGRVHILRGNKKLNNGSFLNYIFLNDDELSADEIQQIIAHEMLHVKLFHSVDRIIVKIAQIILWFNPFVYLYARSIEENHEFEVDREVSNSTDRNKYADLLLHLSVAGQGTLYHNFSMVPLKKRITMLFTKPSSHIKKIIYLLALPVVMISCLAFAKLKSIDKKRYSVINGFDKFGKDPLVLIDNKLRDKDILYKISASCISSNAVFNPEWAIERYGPKAKDGLVNITTKNGVIKYMTPLEKDDLIKERAIPESQLYTRISLKDDKGKVYDKVIIQLDEASRTAQLSHTGKAAFLIDGKLYNENDIKSFSQKDLSSFSVLMLIGGGGSNALPLLHAMGYKMDLSAYEVIFNFERQKSDGINKGADTIKYRQKTKFTAAQIKKQKEDSRAIDAYMETAEGKQKMALSSAIASKTVTFKVLGDYKDKNGKFKGILTQYNGNNYYIHSWYGQTKQLNSRVKKGDEITVKVFSSGVEKQAPVSIIPAFVMKNNEKIFQLAEADKITDIPFYYEVNKVRFAEGQVSNIVKYANGKWKTALFETVNGYKFNLSFKPNAPDMKGIEWGDHVRLRFIHEVKTGAKTYNVNDWVSITTNIRDYGIKNPDWFYKFYTAAPTNSTSATSVNSDKGKYSVIMGLDQMGPNPLVIVDNVEYPKEILYRISKNCIKKSTTYPANRATAEYGDKAKDGVVIINTKEGKITDITPVQRENLVKEYAVAKQFYARIRLKKENGEYYDKAFVHRASGSGANIDISPTDKVGIIINDKLYSESDFKRLFPVDKAEYGNTIGVGPAITQKLPGMDVTGYDIIFKLSDQQDLGSVIHPVKETSLDKNVKQILADVPGVRIKPDGSIWAYNRQVTSIRLDGKDYLVDTSNIPASLIDKIVVSYPTKNDTAKTKMIGFAVKPTFWTDKK